MIFSSSPFPCVLFARSSRTSPSAQDLSNEASHVSLTGVFHDVPPPERLSGFGRLRIRQNPFPPPNRWTVEARTHNTLGFTPSRHVLDLAAGAGAHRLLELISRSLGAPPLSSSRRRFRLAVQLLCVCELRTGFGGMQFCLPASGLLCCEASYRTAEAPPRTGSALCVGFNAIGRVNHRPMGPLR